MALTRRGFVIGGGAAAGAAAIGTGTWAALVRDSVSDRTVGALPSSSTTVAPTAPPQPPPAGADRLLVVVELDGGNDGLDTLVPADGRYRDARPTLAVAESALVELTGTADYALHPALAPLVPPWEAGGLAFVQGVGMAAQNRSHFASGDVWRAGGSPRGTGWLGRWLDLTADGDANPLRGVTLGGGAEALASHASPVTSVRSPGELGYRLAGASDPDAIVDAFLATSAPLSPGPLGRAQAAVDTAGRAVDAFAGLTSVAADGLDVDTSAPTLLGAAAEILGLGVGTRIVYVRVGGYDTHADQRARHSALLAELAEGIEAFFASAEQRGLADRVLLATTSEFGRRVAENGSGGTDHGRGGCQLLLGAGVGGGRVVGELDLGRLEEGDLPITVDGLSLYGEALRWLGGPVVDVLGVDPEPLGLVTAG